MTRDEAKTVFLNRGYVEVEGGTIYDADKWRESCRVISEWLEQESCEDTISRQNDILPNIDKEVESYKKLLKHPVIKSIMGMDETQEQLDFVQPHKKIPVTLTVGGDLISRETVCDYIAEFINHEYSTQSECEMVDLMIKGIQHMPSVNPQPCENAISRQAVDTLVDELARAISDERCCISRGRSTATIMQDILDLPSVKPQEPCDVPDMNDGDMISRQAVLDTISELNAISFYEAQEDSKECYYEIRQAIENLSPVKPQTGHWIEKMDACECPYCHKAWDYCDNDTEDFDYCPKCGTKLSEIPTGSKPEISSYYGLKSYVRERSE